MKRVIGALLVLAIGVVGVARYLVRSVPRVEHVGLLSKEIRLWCSTNRLMDQSVVRDHVSAGDLGPDIPAWVTSGVTAATSCTRGAGTGLALDVVTFSTAIDENLWLLNDSTTPFSILHSQSPNAVFVGDGWVADLGWNDSQSNTSQSQAISSLASALHTPAKFHNFGSVSW